MPLQLKPMEALCGGLSMFLAWKRIGVSWPPGGAGVSKLSLGFPDAKDMLHHHRFSIKPTYLLSLFPIIVVLML
jgi:hypothetical protein